MVYAVSDLHGYPLSSFKALLNKVHFCDSDFLYILGDVIDRNGDGGVEMLRWLLEQTNIQLILGNHEAMLLSCEFVFAPVTQESVADFTVEKMELLNTYLQNGGDVTLKAFRALQRRSPDTVSYILDYLHDAPLYETVTAGENDFLLVHAGMDHFSKNKKLSQYTADDFLWVCPKLTDTYFDDVITIFGHTPTMLYADQYHGKIIKTSTWVNIDVGAAYGQTPTLLRLDDLREFYAG